LLSNNQQIFFIAREVGEKLKRRTASWTRCLAPSSLTFRTYPTYRFKMSSSLESVPVLEHHVFTHGNCVDGLLAAHAYRAWALKHGILTRFYPIAPSEERTWKPALEALPPGAILVFLDVTIPEIPVLQAAGHPVLVIDHHPPVGALPFGSVFSTEKCAALLTFEHLFPGVPVPPLFLSVDRVDRWDEPTQDDLAFREMLHPIARLGVQGGMDKAFEQLDMCMILLAYPSSALQVVAKGHELLAAKMAELDASLVACGGHEITLTKTETDRWALPKEWIGQIAYLVDTTGNHAFDTSLASERIFQTTTATFFVNYRRISWSYRGKEHSKYKYHGRSRKGGLDLTTSLVLKGHPQAAGGELVNDGRLLPFISA